MVIIRLILLLLVLGGLALLLAQNWAPVLPMVFLGLRTQTLPLAIWILLGVTAGAFTSLLIASLFKLSNYFARSSLPKPRYERDNPPRSSTQRSEERFSTFGTPPDTQSTSNNVADDWLSDPTTNNNDWDQEENAQDTRNFSSQNTVRDSTTYEASSEPKSGYQSGVYSYSYRESSNSGVGKTESIYDANYRVIKPPYQQTDKTQDDEEDDWGFEFDDDDDRR